MRSLTMLAAAALLTGCAVRGGAIVSSNPTEPVASQDAEVTPVSLSASTGYAADGIAKCNVLTWKDQIAGIGIVAHGNLVPEYVPLTGREPELATDQPVFVVQFSGTVRHIVMGGPAGWVDVQNAVCALIDNFAYNYGSGDWVDSTGAKGTPGPAPYYTKALPQPLP